MNMLAFGFVHRREKLFRRVVECLIALAALLLPGALPLMFVLWLLKRAQLGVRKPVATKT